MMKDCVEIHGPFIVKAKPCFHCGVFGLHLTTTPGLKLPYFATFATVNAEL